MCGTKRVDKPFHANVPIRVCSLHGHGAPQRKVGARQTKAVEWASPRCWTCDVRVEHSDVERCPRCEIGQPKIDRGDDSHS